MSAHRQQALSVGVDWHGQHVLQSSGTTVAGLGYGDAAADEALWLAEATQRFEGLTVEQLGRLATLADEAGIFDRLDSEAEADELGQRIDRTYDEMRDAT